MYDRLRAEGNELIALVGHFDKGPGDSSRQPTPPCDMVTHNNRRLTCGCVLEGRTIGETLGAPSASAQPPFVARLTVPGVKQRGKTGPPARTSSWSARWLASTP